MHFTNKFVQATYVTRILYFSSLSFNPTPTPKKNPTGF